MNRIAKAADFHELYDIIKNIEPKLNKEVLKEFVKSSGEIDMNKLESIAAGASEMGKKSAVIVLSALI